MCFGGAKAISNVEASGPKKRKHLSLNTFFLLFFLPFSPPPTQLFQRHLSPSAQKSLYKLVKKSLQVQLKYIELQNLKQVVSQVHVQNTES